MSTSNNACPADLFGKYPNRQHSITTYSLNAQEYDQWFETDFLPILQAEFASVIRALRSIFHREDAPFTLLEIGIGTGRFALHVKECFPNCQIFGLEPAEGMAKICRDAFAKRSMPLTLVEQKAEELSQLSLHGMKMDCVLFVTTLGFLEDHQLVLQTIRQHVLVASSGCVCVAFINGETPWGHQYLQYTNGDKFYTNGTCVLNHSHVVELFQRAGFALVEEACFQALMQPDDEETSALDLEALCRTSNHPALKVVPGCGKGMWSVLTFRVKES